MENSKKEVLADFNGLGIDEKILRILEKLNFNNPTPIQLQTIPVVIAEKDVVGIAQTGTGKTLAFGIPMLQKIMKSGGTGLILLPTRELAVQVDESIRNVGQRLGLKTAVLIGGEHITRQFTALRRQPHIVVATPGRLIDHLKRNTLNLKSLKVLVFDEADMMFDMGFSPQIHEILKLAPRERQTLLFSATMPPAVMEIATKHMKLPVRIEVAPAGTPADNIIQEMIVIKMVDRTAQLEKILNEYKGSVLIFVRTKRSVKDLCHRVKGMGFKATEMHSDRSLFQRKEALEGFKSGRFRVLLATDIAARGIDVKGIELVINYDLPEKTEDYIHRIGRTGRAGESGRAISFVLPSQSRNIRDIESIIKANIPITKLTEMNAVRSAFGGSNRRGVPGGYKRKRFAGGPSRPRTGGFGSPVNKERTSSFNETPRREQNSGFGNSAVRERSSSFGGEKREPRRGYGESTERRPRTSSANRLDGTSSRPSSFNRSKSFSQSSSRPKSNHKRKSRY